MLWELLFLALEPQMGELSGGWEPLLYRAGSSRGDISLLILNQHMVAVVPARLHLQVVLYDGCIIPL